MAAGANVFEYGFAAFTVKTRSATHCIVHDYVVCQRAILLPTYDGLPLCFTFR